MQHLPRVSTILHILEDSYAGVPQSVLDHAAERGEELHRLCLTYLASLTGLCEAPGEIRQDYRAAYEAFVKWCAEFDVYPIAIEQEGINTLNGFLGHPDALILFGPIRRVTLIDLKFTATILRINKVQVIAYWHLDLYEEATGAMLVHINPTTGHLNVHTIKNSPTDWCAFLNALSIWRWREAA